MGILYDLTSKKPINSNATKAFKDLHTDNDTKNNNITEICKINDKNKLIEYGYKYLNLDCDVDSALACFKKADYKEPDMYLDTAKYYFNQYDKDLGNEQLLRKSEQVLREGIKVYNNNPYLYYELSRTLWTIDSDGSIKYLKIARKLSNIQNKKDNELICNIEHNLIKQYILREDYPNTIDTIISLKKNGYIDEELLMELGIAYEEIGNSDKAIKTYNEAIKYCKKSIDKLCIDEECQRMIDIVAEATEYLIELYRTKKDYLAIEKCINDVLNIGLLKEDFENFKITLNVIQRDISRQKIQQNKQKFKVISK